MYPRSAADYYQRQQRILALLLTAIRLVWRRMKADGSWQEQYEQGRVGEQLTMLVTAAQQAAAEDADGYIAEVLVELGIVAAASKAAAPGVVIPSAFAGIAGDGRTIETLLALAVPQAGRTYSVAISEIPTLESRVSDLSRLDRPGAFTEAAWRTEIQARGKALAAEYENARQEIAQQALAQAGRWIEEAAATAVIDAARAAESAAATARPQVAGYVRMLNPPSCSRCAVLAGRFYRWDAGFERHPLCDCRSIPVSESMAGEYTVDPDAYFTSLPTAAELDAEHPDLTVAMRREAGLISQEDVFTVAGARAIRDGADIGQVVNARRGMQTAQVAGQNLLVTTAGRSRRGRRRGAPPRLMPSTIYEVAEDREDAIRLLRANSFIT